MSLVQFNLLPDVKLEFNRAQQVKKLVFTISALVVGIVLIVFTLSFLSVYVVQKKLLNDEQAKIDKYSQQLKDIPDLDKVLTVQNQLNSLPALHESKHYTSRLYTYLPQLVPKDVQISKLTLDTAANTISIEGTVENKDDPDKLVSLVNKFVDTLKFTLYPVSGVKNEDDCSGANGKWDKDKQICTKAAFPKVTLSKIDRNDKKATYIVDATYDPVLFDAKQTVKLNVPDIITTRSVVNSPNLSDNPLFNQPPKEESQ